MILSIESATPRGSVALVAGGILLAERFLPLGRTHSETFLSAVERLFVESGTGAERVGHVAVSVGPGSFTGLRVGMAAAKGFCFGWGTPLVSVPTLHALAVRFPREGATICPVLDARKQEVYAGIYRWAGGVCFRIAPDTALPPERLPEMLPDGPILFCGEGILPYRRWICDRLGARALFPPAGDEFPRAAAVGVLAERLLAEGAGGDLRATVPAYLRPSEAERKRRG